ncbi:MAG: T9SS type A sorting domain-containing protein [Saprospirales bacterium]|nr:T9SS type A sorting domain-containing protein [Saprospirales bacterium]
MYYKFNQGVPGEDNTSISSLICEIEPGVRDGNLVNFALTGETSNFGGELNSSFQAITFPQIPDKLISDPPFTLNASTSSGLPVIFEVVSGPAVVVGDIVTLTGEVGEVLIKASQPGDGSYDPAADLFNSFQVLDPDTYVPVTDARSPLSGDVFVPTLGPIQLAAISSIGYPDLFSVTNVKFEIDGTSIDAKDWGNDHYTGWWTPPAYGVYTLNIIATNNYGASSTETVNFTVVDQASNMVANAGQQVWLNSDIGSQIVEAELPSYAGAFDQIIATLDISCPPGGCDPWDRVSGVEVKGHNGEWYEVIRYITPYGTACSHSVDLTDFMSILQGKVAVRFYLGTQGNGFEYTLNLSYKAGTPDNAYSSITKLWYKTYQFGDPANLQPCEVFEADFPANTQAAKIKLVSSGHGWGDNNTGNAAEFHHDIHHIHINGTQTFAQDNWQDCNPNPDGCNPQNGTWFYDRAGWCPGSIAPWFDFDMTPYVGSGSIEYKYIFNENYVDVCHPNNPDCYSGIQCPNCDDGFNPHLIVSSYLISLGDSPLEDAITGAFEPVQQELAFQVDPNPSSGVFNLKWGETTEQVTIRVLNTLGRAILVQQADGLTNTAVLDLQQLPKGIYFVQLDSGDGKGIRKVLVE